MNAYSVNVQLLNDDCLIALKTLADNSIDSVVTDPPYGLNFMGKEWDRLGDTSADFTNLDKPHISQESFPMKKSRGRPICETNGKAQQDWHLMWAKECLRVLKPGGFLLAFGGSRTYHRMACAIEDAGFEIRDQIMWVYGSGFPKSLNIGKVTDKFLKTGNASWNGTGDSSNGALGYSKLQHQQGYRPDDYSNKHQNKNVITEEKAKEWEGWGTALKPAHEPIVLARKPLSEKTVVENVLKWGVGGINIDECRVPVDKEIDKSQLRTMNRNKREIDNNEQCWGTNKKESDNPIVVNEKGRFPANIIHDGSEEVLELFPDCKGWASQKHNAFNPYGGNSLNKSKSVRKGEYEGYNDNGSAARFFYCAKASSKERNSGLEGLEYKDSKKFDGGEFKSASTVATERKSKNHHPTVKPIMLMKYLICLVTPKNGLVLDPFLGSGTTGIAAKSLGCRFVGIEQNKEYFEIAKKRIEGGGNG